MKAFLLLSLELQLTLLFGVVRLREWLVLQLLRKERLGPVEKRGQRKPAREDVLVHGKELSPERNEPWDVVNEMGSGLLQLPDPRWGTGSGQTVPGPAAFVGASQPEGSRVGT